MEQQNLANSLLALLCQEVNVRLLPLWYARLLGDAACFARGPLIIHSRWSEAPLSYCAPLFRTNISRRPFKMIQKFLVNIQMGFRIVLNVLVRSLPNSLKKLFRQKKKNGLN